MLQKKKRHNVRFKSFWVP